MGYDYDRRRRTARSHVWVEKGKLIQVKNVVTMAGVLMQYDDCVIEEGLEWQLYDERNAPVSASYRGPGQVLDRGSEKVLLIGDPARHGTLTEYRIDKDQTPESEKRLDAVIAGVKAAIGDFKPARRQTSKGQDWLRGYDEAMAHRKKVTRK